MGSDLAAGKAKRSELVALASARLAEMSLNSQDPGLGERIIEACCVITPPEFPRIYITDSVNMKVDGGGGAVTRKPGNLVLNLRKLLIVLAALPLAAIGVKQRPWTAPLVALILWDSIWSKLELSIEEREASVLWAMWLNRDETTNHTVKSGFLSVVNEERDHHGRAPVSQPELDDAIAKLSKLGCVVEEEPTYFLRESVHVDFS